MKLISVNAEECGYKIGYMAQKEATWEIPDRFLML
jgi:hypothetical protein